MSDSALKDRLGILETAAVLRNMGDLVEKIADEFKVGVLPEGTELTVLRLVDDCCAVGKNYVRLRDYVWSIDKILAAVQRVVEATHGADRKSREYQADNLPVAAEIDRLIGRCETLAEVVRTELRPLVGIPGDA